MAKLFVGDAIREKYYSADKPLLDRVRHITGTFKAEFGMDKMYRGDLNNRFLAEVELHRTGRLYIGKEIYEEVRIELPSSFAALL